MLYHLKLKISVPLSLKQLIEEEPTRITPHSSTLLDLITLKVETFANRNFREQKLSRILALFAKVNVTKFLELSHSRKLMFAKFSYDRARQIAVRTLVRTIH